jgi:hypothetical protein
MYLACYDKDHKGNSDKHYTGKSCITPKCNNPAGTAWSPLWCFDCNVKRLKRINKNLAKMIGRERSKR